MAQVSIRKIYKVYDGDVQAVKGIDLEIAQGEHIRGTEWLLDTLLFPDSASRDPVFLVQNADVIDVAIGVSP